MAMLVYQRVVFGGVDFFRGKIPAMFLHIHSKEALQA